MRYVLHRLHVTLNNALLILDHVLLSALWAAPRALLAMIPISFLVHMLLISPELVHTQSILALQTCVPTMGLVRQTTGGLLLALMLYRLIGTIPSLARPTRLPWETAR